MSIERKGTETGMRDTGREEIENAKLVFENLAKRLDALWLKDKLTKEEQKKVDLILNNAMVAQEILDGKEPHEVSEE